VIRRLVARNDDEEPELLPAAQHASGSRNSECGSKESG
jgi:hypothetical protein